MFLELKEFLDKSKNKYYRLGMLSGFLAIVMLPIIIAWLIITLAIGNPVYAVFILNGVQLVFIALQFIFFRIWEKKYYKNVPNG